MAIMSVKNNSTKSHITDYNFFFQHTCGNSLPGYICDGNLCVWHRQMVIIDNGH